MVLLNFSWLLLIALTNAKSLLTPKVLQNSTSALGTSLNSDNGIVSLNIPTEINEVTAKIKKKRIE